MNRTNLRNCVLLLALGLSATIAAGFAHGKLTHRWGPTRDLRAAADNLDRFPKKVGPWEVTDEMPMANEVIRTLSCAGYVHRQYVNRETGQTISMAMIVGPPGPTSVHTPEICYSSRAYTADTPREQIQVTDDDQSRSHTFWALSFRPNTPTTDRLRVLYAWCSDELWMAPESPRVTFAGEPLLYKLQLACLSTPNSEATVDSPCEEFIADLLKTDWKPTAHGIGDGKSN